jgi:hypothetical protein
MKCERGGGLRAVNIWWSERLDWSHIQNCWPMDSRLSRRIKEHHPVVSQAGLPTPPFSQF